MNKKNIFEGRRQILLFLPSPWIVFKQFWKETGDSTKRMRNLRSAFENADSQWEQIFKCHLESSRTQINIISPSMFHLNRVINGYDDVALEEDFEIQKPLEVLI